MSRRVMAGLVGRRAVPRGVRVNSGVREPPGMHVRGDGGPGGRAGAERGDGGGDRGRGWRGGGRGGRRGGPCGSTARLCAAATGNRVPTDPLGAAMFRVRAMLMAKRGFIAELVRAAAGEQE
jgi:hypothetical protein